MKEFKQKGGIGKLIIRVLLYPISMRKVFGVDIEIGMSVFIAIMGIFVLILPYTWISSVLGKGAKLPPFYCWAPLLGLLVIGLFSGRKTILVLKEFLGLDPKILYQPGTIHQLNEKEKGWTRYIGYLILAGVISSVLSWFWWVFPLDYFELEVYGKMWPTTAFLRTWFTYIIPNFTSFWFLVFSWTIVVIVILDFLPLIRRILRRTKLAEITAGITFTVWLILMAIWWYNIFFNTNEF